MRPELRRPVLFAGVVAVLAALVWVTRNALMPFAVGLVLAYLVLPLVSRLQRALPRGVGDGPHGRLVAVLTVYLAALIATVVALSVLVPPLFEQAVALLANTPALYEGMADLAQSSAAAYDEALVRVTGDPEAPEALEPFIGRIVSEDTMSDLASGVLGAVRSALRAMLAAVTNTVSQILAFFVIPFWMVYVMNDSGRLVKGAVALVPAWLRPDLEAVRFMTDENLSAYIRGQIIIAAVLGALTTLALTVLGVPYSLLVGVAAGTLGLIPYLGAILGAILSVVVALSVSGTLAIATLVAVILIQQVDNFVVTPRVQGESVALHPAVIMVVLVIGQALVGPVGLLIAVPLTAICRDLTHYAWLRAGTEPMEPGAALATVGYPPQAPQERAASSSPGAGKAA